MAGNGATYILRLLSNSHHLYAEADGRGRPTVGTMAQSTECEYSEFESMTGRDDKVTIHGPYYTSNTSCSSPSWLGYFLPRASLQAEDKSRSHSATCMMTIDFHNPRAP